MEKKKRIDEEVNRTLNIFDEIPQIKENPFLYTKIKARLDGETSAGKQKNYLAGILKPALLALILTLNALTAYYYFDTDLSSQQTTSSYSLVDQLNEEYTTNKIELTDLNLE